MQAAAPYPDVPAVTVAIARDPALVRTVRLVAAAVARRTGSDENFVEEVRLAAGEACALMLRNGLADAGLGPVTVRLSIGDRLEVLVTSQGPMTTEDPSGTPHSGVEPMDPWALLRGLIDDVEVRERDGHTTVRMAWPLRS